MKLMRIPEEATGFNWDENNILKNWDQHRISYWECEEIFFNKPLIIRNDKEHSDSETRYYALGKTDSARKIFVAFTMRDTLIRPISFREMTRKEKRIYEQSKIE
jgi:uncharacterized protein